MTIGKRAIILTLIFLLLCSNFTTMASVPYTSYVYDDKNQPVPAPDAYSVAGVLDGAALGTEALNTPQGIFCDASNQIYIADTGNNRILFLSKDLKFVRELKNLIREDGTPDTLNSPQDVFVTAEGILYISDTGNNRVLICNSNGRIRKIITRPTGDLFDQSMEFRPRDLVVTKAGILYVLVEGVYQGAVAFNSEGEFTGYFGSNKVQANFSLLIDYFWKQFMTAEQKARMRRYVPVQYSSIQIDSEDFVYLTTEVADDKTQRVRKLNAQGKDILKKPEFYGDSSEYLFQGERNATTLVDVEIVGDKYITVLDRTHMRIFQYSQESDLLTTFGCSGTLQGGFIEPVGICGFDDKIFVLDAKSNAITVFRLTEYGRTLHTAIDIYNDGRYQDSLPYWHDILKHHSTSILANRGIGKALYQEGRSEEALVYFKRCNDTDGYSEAFDDVRRQSIRENFSWIVLGLAGFVAAVILVIRFHLLQRLFRLIRRKIRYKKEGGR